MDSISGTLRQEASLLADFRINEILDIIQANRARGRIYLLRRNKTIPRNQVEADYLIALHNYVRCKLLGRKDPRRAWLATGGYLNSAANFREQMTRLEESIAKECKDEEKISGVFDVIGLSSC
jgi:hypothetical protein